MKLARLVMVVLLALSTDESAIAQSNPFGGQGTPTGSQTGDGAAPFQGVSASPEANLFTGTASSSIDLVVPPGRDKMTPKVTLQYSSAAGRSAYGYGWSVAVSKVSRSTKRGVPRFEDSGANSDEFVLELNGSSIELMHVSGNLYGPKVEGSFMRIGYDPAQTNSWKVIDRDGTIYWFGTSTNTRLGPDNAIASGTSAWLLTRVQDLSGNTIDYTYLGGGASEQAGLPSRISYGSHLSETPLDQYRVEFTWDTPSYPATAPVSWASGYAERAGSRLQRIVTKARWHWSRSDFGADNEFDVVREYTFEHALDGRPAGGGTGSGISTLSAVGLQAYGVHYGDLASPNDPTDTVTIPPSLFQYAPTVLTGWPTGSSTWATLPKTPAPVLPADKKGRFRDREGKMGDGKSRFDTMDINGDSIPDYLHATNPSQTEAFVRFGYVTDDPQTGMGIGLGPVVPLTWPTLNGDPLDPQTFVRQVQTTDGDVQASIFDITGDGLPELVDTSFGRCSEFCGSGHFWCIYEQDFDSNGDLTGFAVNPSCWIPPATGGSNAQEINAIRGGNQTLTNWDTVDFDGDGRLDIIAGDHGYSGPATVWWYIENRYVENPNSGNPVTVFAAAVPIPLPSSFLGTVCDVLPLQYGTLSPRTCSAIAIDNEHGQWGLYDINGDGLKDLVVAEDDSSGDPGTRLDRESYWKVYLNQGGFRSNSGRPTFADEPIHWMVESSQVYRLPNKISMRADDGGATISDLVDMTGDGLPDLVRRHAAGTDSPSTGAIPYHCDGTGNGPGVGSTGKILSQNDCWNLLVYVNTGSSFSEPIAWPSPTNAIRADYQECVDPATGLGGCYDIMDFNADGLVDLLANAWGTTSGDYAWTLALHPSSPHGVGGGYEGERTKPGVLVSMMNGLGAKTDLEYSPVSHLDAGPLPFPYWVVTHTSTTEQFTGSMPTAEYLYDGVAYDRADKEFRGFAWVRAVDALGRSTVTEFLQDDRRKGSIFRKSLLGAIPETCDTETDDPTNSDECDPEHWLLAVDETDWGPAATYETLAGTMDPLLREEVVSTPYRTAGGAPQPAGDLRKTTIYGHDAYGNETSREILVGSGGGGSGGASIALTESEYTIVDSGGTGMPTRYLPSRPAHITTYDVVNGAAPVSEQYFEYFWTDAWYGKVASVSVCREWAGGVCRASSLTKFETYDQYGNLLKKLSPIRGRTQYAFYRANDGGTVFDGKRQYPGWIKDAAGLESWHIYDPGTGTELSATDANGVTVQHRYDGLGRPIKSWIDDGNGPFTESHPQSLTRYTTPAEGGCATPPCTPGMVEHYEMRGWSGETMLYSAPPSVTFYDGFSRVLGVKRRIMTDDGGSPVTVVSNVQKFDSSGTVKASALPFEAVNSSLTTWVETIDHAVARTTFEHDQHGRLIAKQLPDLTRIEYQVDEPGVRVTLDPNLVDGGHPGAAAIETFDALGRKIAAETCGSVPGPHADCNDSLARSYYTYDALDRQVRFRQATDPGSAGSPLVTVTETEYDGLGNVTRKHDYDAGGPNESHGTFTFTYDAAGNVVKARTPDGAYTRNRYDPASRLLSTSTRQSGRGKTGAVYTFGLVPSLYGYEAGRVVNVTSLLQDSDGNKTIVSKDFTYTSHGLVDSVSERVLSDSFGTTELTTVNIYDAADRLVETTYPARAGSDIGTEILRTVFNDYGQARRLEVRADGGGGLLRTLVSSVDYDIYGNTTHMAYGNGVHDHAKFAPPSGNLRLDCLRTTRSGVAPDCTGFNASVDYQALDYGSYDPAGRILEIDDLRGSGVGDATLNDQELTYDALGRLSTVRYGGSGELESYGFDGLGNMTSRTSTTTGTVSYVYGSPHPHRLTSYAGTTLTYDNDGNRETKGAATTYDYDPLGRLTYAEGPDGSEMNAYDESTSRVVRYSPEEMSVRHYLAGGMVEVDQTELRRYFFLGSRRVAMDTVSLPSSPDHPIWTDAPGILATAFAGRGKGGGSNATAGAMNARRAVAARFVAAQSGEAARQAAAGCLVLVLISGVWVLVMAPGRRQRVAGMTAVLVFASALPLPAGWRMGRILSGASEAEASITPEFWFFHADHVGSVQVLTDWPASGNAAAVDDIRYRAYGGIRCAGGACGATAEPASPRTFTGHERDGSVGLLYMGARFYDPDIGGFLTFDPAAQYSSPYAYGGHNPLGGSDPSGAMFEIMGVLVAAALSATATFVDTLARGGDFGTALKAGVGTGVMATAGSPQGLVVGVLGAIPIVGPAVIAASFAFQGYNVVQSAKDGNIATALVSAALLADGVYKASGGENGLVDRMVGSVGGRLGEAGSLPDLGDLPSDGRSLTYETSFGIDIEVHGGADDVVRLQQAQAAEQQFQAGGTGNRAVSAELGRGGDRRSVIRLRSSYAFPRAGQGARGYTAPSGDIYVDPRYESVDPGNRWRPLDRRILMAHEFGHRYGGTNGGMTRNNALGEGIATAWERLRVAELRHRGEIPLY